MKPRFEEEIAELLGTFYRTDFEGKASGSFRIQRAKFRELAGRARLESAVVERVAKALLHNSGLILVQGTDFFAVLGAKQFERVRVLPYQLIPKNGTPRR